MPDIVEMYPAGLQPPMSSSASLTEDLCGAARPNHFDGVATVVTKLLLQCAPDCAVFGEKDYQQLLVDQAAGARPRHPGRDRLRPIVREHDGLALSSRNVYLSPAERKTAPVLHQVLTEMRRDLAERRRAATPPPGGRFKLEGSGFRVDYVAVRDPETLEPLDGPVQRPGAGACRGLSRPDAADRQLAVRSLTIDQAKLAQILAHALRHVVRHPSSTSEIGRRVGRLEIAPALEGAPGCARVTHQLRIEHDAATGHAVILDVGPEIEHALAHQHVSP